MRFRSGLLAAFNKGPENGVVQVVDVSWITVLALDCGDGKLKTDCLLASTRSNHESLSETGTAQSWRQRWEDIGGVSQEGTLANGTRRMK